jgi:hypothetical protein
MIYRFLADLLLIVHLLFILFVLFGGFLILWKKWIIPIHLVCASWGVAIELFRWVCPLTPLENDMRMLSGQAGYEGGFIEHYLMPIVYPGQLTPDIQFILGSLVMLTNIFIYYFVVQRIRKRKRRERPEI